MMDMISQQMFLRIVTLLSIFDLNLIQFIEIKEHAVGKLKLFNLQSQYTTQ